MSTRRSIKEFEEKVRQQLISARATVAQRESDVRAAEQRLMEAKAQVDALQYALDLAQPKKP